MLGVILGLYIGVILGLYWVYRGDYIGIMQNKMETII